MASIDVEYHELCREILREGYTYMDESRGIMCKQISSYTLEIDKVFTHFPLMTTKKMFTKGIVGELIWFLRGESNIKYLNDNNIKIWDKDANNFSKNGDVGRNYGVQWRDWKGKPTLFKEDGDCECEYTNNFDQITNLIDNLLVKPMSRRHIVTAWNPGELLETALPPCHWAFEIIPYPIADEYKHLLPGYDYFFDLKWHQRSVDTFLGLPFNITSYALLMRIIGELTNMLPNKLIGDLSNVHFYEPHIKLVQEQLHRSPFMYSEPEFEFSRTAKHYFEAFRNSIISDNGSNFDYILSKINIEDFIFTDYESYPAIKAEMYEPKNINNEKK